MFFNMARYSDNGEFETWLISWLLTGFIDKSC